MTNIALELSAALGGAVERAGRSVVRVDARHRWPASGTVWDDTGTIVTASHAVEREEGIEVLLADGRTLPATLAGRDPATDLAVLRVEANLGPPAWRGLDGLQVGHLVLAVARPGRTVRAAAGIVSALGDAWRAPAGGKIERYLETDIGLEPGFSGGLLIDVTGQALGLHTAGLLRGRVLALPAATVTRVAGAILAHGAVRRGFIGIGTQPVRLKGVLAARAGQASGLLVVSVQPDTAADRAGLLVGDIVVALGEEPVERLGDLLGLLDEEQVEVPTTLRLVRGGELVEVPLTIGARP
jgi:S1-C subfamily serine protease